MDALTTAVAGVYLSVVLVTLIAGLAAWRVRQRAALAGGFAAILWTGTWWSLFDLLQMLGPLPVRVDALYLWLIGPSLLAIAFGALVRLLIDDQWRPGTPLVTGIVVYLLAVSAGLLVPQTRALVLRSTRAVGAGTLHWVPGPGFWSVIAVNFAAFVVIWVMLAHAMRHSRPRQRRQLGLVLAAAAVLVAGGSVSLVPIVRHGYGSGDDLDLTVLGFAVAAILFLRWLGVAGALMPGAGLRALVLDALAESVLVVDRAGRVIDLNPVAVELLGSPAPRGRPVAEVLSRLGPDVVAQSGRYRYGHYGDGEIDLHVSPLHDAGEVVGTVVVIRDVTDVARDRKRVVESNLALRDEIRSMQLMRQEIDDAALVDPDTGLANRRAILEMLDAVVSDGEEPVGVVRLDIDTVALARVRALRGEPRGGTVDDELVRLVATVIDQCAPQGTTLGRISGAGFAVLLPGGDADSARHLVEDVRAELDRRDDGCPIGAGVAAVARVSAAQGRRPASYVILARAEDALGDSLARGRGQVVIDRRD